MEKIDHHRERIDETAYLAEQLTHPTNADLRIIRLAAQLAIQERNEG